jgi:hypothetical protein
LTIYETIGSGNGGREDKNKINTTRKKRIRGMNFLLSKKNWLKNIPDGSRILFE